jgi:DDE superfamily endonuclease
MLVAKAFEITDFSASSGWLANFKKRNLLKSFKKRGEAGSAPIDEIPKFQQELQEILKEYELKNIFNCDETALYYRLEPNKSLAHFAISGNKRPKERISIMLTCNAIGNEKLPLLVIHKYQNPRALQGIAKNTLPVWYYWNKKAWMQRSIFKHFLERLNGMMRIQSRQIILLLDNAQSHNSDNIFNLSHIKVHFLPPNTTSHIQPLDQGIIYSLKVSLIIFNYYYLSILKFILINLFRLNIANFYV